MNKRAGKHKPPGIPRRLFEKMYPDSGNYTTVGDLDEVYNNISLDRGKVHALTWYWWQLSLALFPSVSRKLYGSMIMFVNYLKITFRNIYRQKGYSIINISGLAIGLTCSILILLWVLNELSFDNFHENSDTLYIVGTKMTLPNRTYTGTGTPPAFGPALKVEYPEVVNSARLQNGSNRLAVMYKDKVFTESVRFGDFSFLEMFSFPLITGNVVSSQNNPEAIYLSESIAEKYFGDEDPLGRVLTIDRQYDFKVAGVMKNFPQNSVVRFDILAPLETIESMYNNPNGTRTWSNLSFITLAQVRENTDIEDFNTKINGRIITGNGGEEDVRPFLAKYTDIYLYGITGEGGNIGRIILFAIVAVFILSLACINFMNLSTARATTRAKEVGMRKVVGARRSNLITQFLGESLIFSFISFCISIGMVYFALPYFTDLAQSDLTIGSVFNIPVFTGLLMIVFLTGIVSGSYPAFFLAAFRPVKVIKGIPGVGNASSLFRKSLVVLQFFISIGLIICTLVVSNQLAFVGGRDLGYDKDNMIYLPVKGELKNQYFAAREELERIPGVLYVTSTQTTVTGVYWNGHNWDWEGKDENVDPMITYLFTDQNFAESFNINIEQGRFFQSEFENGEKDSQNVIINEAFAGLIGKETVVGSRIFNGDGTPYNVIGVIKDFNFKSLYNQIEPIVLFYSPRRFNQMYIRINSENVDDTISRIESVFKTFNPEFPFEYRFLDERIELMYSGEKRFGNIFKSFALLAVIISCLGLFGLASFMTSQRTKEIGIRKVLGASVTGVIILLSREFAKWVVIANVIAWPVAGYYMNQWLENFAYRTSIGINTYLIAGGVALIVAVLTISYQAIKAAVSRPVDSLRYE